MNSGSTPFQTTLATNAYDEIDGEAAIITSACGP
jgi:hypothetical protein